MKKRIIITYLTAAVSGMVFKLFHFPLPWILGPVTGLLIYKLITHSETQHYLFGRNIAFSLLGIQIGLTFNSQTFQLVWPYFFPYTSLSVCMIALSIGFAYLLSKYIAVDAKTSMIGSAPGGLSAMIAVSETYKGNTVLVTIFHTIRLLSVLFILPFIASHWLMSTDGTSLHASAVSENGPLWTVALYGVVFYAGYLLQTRIPASLVIVPMLITGMIQAIGLPLYHPPMIIFIIAQLLIGVHLGHSIAITDIKKAGTYSFYYLLLSILVIMVGIGFGFLLSDWTGMDLVTAVLSLAPGGLVEMAITAKDTGGDPSVVSSLQTIRLLTIVLLLPFLFKWILPGIKK